MLAFVKSGQDNAGMAGRELVLIVDDTVANVRMLEAMLVRLGYRTLLVDSGQRAVELAAEKGPDLILLDIMMPGMDGFETCRQLKLKPLTRQIPVVFMTALSSIQDKLRAFEVGGVDYITKPFTAEEVTARVKAYLTIRRLQNELLTERERFVRLAAHDLRNPLTALIGCAEQGSKAKSADDLTRGFQQIQELASWARATLDRSLGWPESASPSGGAMEPFALEKVMERVLSQQAYAARLKGIEISVQLPDGTMSALGNPAQTCQILTNYLSNAIKHSPPYLLIVVEAKRVADRWRVSIQDQGPGVAEEQRDLLFKNGPGLLADPAAGGGRTGIGLPVAKMLAESQEGCVGAQFPPEGGAIFWVEIPMTPVK